MTNPTFVPYRIVPDVEPVIRQLFSIANATQTTRKDMARKAGVSVATISTWEAGRRPRIDLVDACFQAMGYELAPRRRAA